MGGTWANQLLIRPLRWAAAAALLACASPPPPVPVPAETTANIVVRSNVHGDVLSIDGQVLGPTSPKAHTVASGRHVIVVTKAGHSQWQTVVDLVPGEERTLIGSLTPITGTSTDFVDAAKPSNAASWSATVAFLRDKLRDRWESGDPPEDFDVSNEGMMEFRLRNPADPSVWHHYMVDVRKLAVSPDDLAPSVVSLQCRGTPCFHQETCRNGDCSGAKLAAQQRWFLSDATQGKKVTRALEHLIALAKQRPPPAPPDELF